jgi:8-oxo-dGTP pyrophosphatase MutT (NUDIX family)
MTIYCNNCGNEGHVYKHCKFPVLSYGVICFTKDSQILMIQRKDSINYIEFLRGKYKLDDIPYIVGLLNGCSVEERTRLVSYNFDDLWNRLWFSGQYKKPQTDRMIKEYNKSKQLFGKVNLTQLVKECDKNYLTPEWEIPKGRRSYRENNLDCAVREFEEETDLDNTDYDLLKNVAPISEEYMGTNGVRYKHIYYYAMYKGNKELSINLDKYEQYSEIGDIQWFSFSDAINKIRPENPTKTVVLQQAQRFIEQWSDDYFLKE